MEYEVKNLSALSAIVLSSDHRATRNLYRLCDLVAANAYKLLIGGVYEEIGLAATSQTIYDPSNIFVLTERSVEKVVIFLRHLEGKYNCKNRANITGTFIKRENFEPLNTVDIYPTMKKRKFLGCNNSIHFSKLETGSYTAAVLHPDLLRMKK